MNEQEPLPELPELPELPQETIITPMSRDRFTLLLAGSQPCDCPINDVDRSVLVDMSTQLDELDTGAAGLAAVQIGYPKRMFMLRRKGVNQAFINPVVTNVSRDKSRKREGCLSLPNMAFRIARPKSLTLTWFDESGASQTENFTGFWARAVCHEMDHLNGTILAEHPDSVLVREVPRKHFKAQEGSMIVDEAFKKRLAARRAKKKRARQQRVKR
jgi:peptide deformylase